MSNYWEGGADRRENENKLVTTVQNSQLRIDFLIYSSALPFYPDRYYFIHFTDKETEARRQQLVSGTFCPRAVLFPFQQIVSLCIRFAEFRSPVCTGQAAGSAQGECVSNSESFPESTDLDVALQWQPGTTQNTFYSKAITHGLI